jgi:alkaline phosphatase
MRKRVNQITAMSLVAATLSGLSMLAYAETTPTVGGPESVQDWWRAGQEFIRESQHERDVRRRAKNVILFVGDGMGISTVTAARILEGQMKNAPGEENQLFFEAFPNVALSKTYSWDQQTSDSAPTMTAMVTGYKGREGQLSVNHTTTRYECNADVIASKSLETILEQAAHAGKATGIVSTARITHATPAANYAHTPMRDWESDAEIRAFEAANNLPANSCTVRDIARQLVESSPAVKKSLRVVLGGGRSYFMPAAIVDPEDGGNNRGRRKDGRDLTKEWVQNRGQGAKFVFDKAGFDAAHPHSTPYLLGLFERSHMEYEADRLTDRGGEPSLTEMTEKAIRMVSDDHQGFYLQIEGGRIDHAHHAGNPYRALTDAIEFSNAIRRAYEMTDPDETLIIVTADHSHVFTIAGYPHRGNPILGKVREVPDRDGQPATLSKDLIGLPYTTLGYANGPGYTGASDVQPAGIKTFPHVPASATNTAVRPDLTNVDTTAQSFMPEATVPLSSETHAGEDVAIYATGPRSHLFRGVMEQNWIYHVMREAFNF